MFPKFILFPASTLVGKIFPGTHFAKCYSTL